MRITSAITRDKRLSLYHKIAQYDRYLQSLRYRQTYRQWGDFSFFTLLFITYGEARVDHIRQSYLRCPWSYPPTTDLLIIHAQWVTFLVQFGRQETQRIQGSIALSGSNGEWHRRTGNPRRSGCGLGADKVFLQSRFFLVRIPFAIAHGISETKREEAERLARIREENSPLDISLPTRFEHTHIVAGTGHGKTQLLQSLILADLPEVSNRITALLSS